MQATDLLVGLPNTGCDGVAVRDRGGQSELLAGSRVAPSQLTYLAQPGNDAFKPLLPISVDLATITREA